MSPSSGNPHELQFSPNCKCYRTQASLLGASAGAGVRKPSKAPESMGEDKVEAPHGWMGSAKGEGVLEGSKRPEAGLASAN